MNTEKLGGGGKYATSRETRECLQNVVVCQTKGKVLDNRNKHFQRSPLPQGGLEIPTTPCAFQGTPNSSLYQIYPIKFCFT